MKRVWRGDQVTVRIGDRVIEVEDVAFSDALDAVNRKVADTEAAVAALAPVPVQFIGSVGITLVGAEKLERAAMEASASLRALQSVLLRADPLSGRRGRVRGFQRSRSIARHRWEE